MFEFSLLICDSYSVLWRVALGPTAYDRILAVNAVGSPSYNRNNFAWVLYGKTRVYRCRNSLYLNQFHWNNRNIKIV